MLIICIVVALLVSALLCLVMLGHHIERQRQRDIVFARLVRQRRIQPCVKVNLDSIMEPSKLTAREINEGFAKVRREREARSAPYPTPSRGRRYEDTEVVNPMHFTAPYPTPSRGRRYEDTEVVNPMHFTAPYPTPSRSNDCAVIGVDMAAAADRTVVTHCHAPSSYSHGGSDSYSCSSDSGYSSSSCDSSSSSSCCD